ncbi:unnamed protein product [Protopolystoma xenopodis]|uniref:Uncharacterized protein n=1 Tax=Protopolystoma xenopodis TaxID=117903 RepID=A0A3S5BPI1_9PLAT|nr:unnamed protein product [Protopolystoma xenopodis]
MMTCIGDIWRHYWFSCLPDSAIFFYTFCICGIARLRKAATVPSGLFCLHSREVCHHGFFFPVVGFISPNYADGYSRFNFTFFPCQLISAELTETKRNLRLLAKSNAHIPLRPAPEGWAYD